MKTVIYRRMQSPLISTNAAGRDSAKSKQNNGGLRTVPGYTSSTMCGWSTGSLQMLGTTKDLLKKISMNSSSWFSWGHLMLESDAPTLLALAISLFGFWPYKRPANRDMQSRFSWSLSFFFFHLAILVWKVDGFKHMCIRKAQHYLVCKCHNWMQQFFFFYPFSSASSNYRVIFTLLYRLTKHVSCLINTCICQTGSSWRLIIVIVNRDDNKKNLFYQIYYASTTNPTFQFLLLLDLNLSSESCMNWKT